MLILVYAVPVITCLILLLWFRQYTLWWEYLIVLLPSILLSTVIYFGVVRSKTYDTEYLGYYVTKVEYYEDWDEWVHRTCTRTYTDSKGNTHTETYDCSHSVYHPEYWEMTLSDQSTQRIPEELYDDIVRKFAKKPVFIDLHRHYYRDDGDKYVCVFDGNRNRLWPITFSHSYDNRVLGSKSIFNFQEVTNEEIVENGLYDYPEVRLYDQEPIIGDGLSVPKAIVDSFKYINAIYGERYRFRVYVMLFLDKGREVAKLEQDFLVGGNMNELIVCIGVDRSGKVNWVESFSWEDEPIISVGVNHLYHKGEPLRLLKLNRYLLENVPKSWKNKDRDDFEYLSIELSSNEWTTLIMLTIVINLILSIYVIKNEFS